VGLLERAQRRAPAGELDLQFVAGRLCLTKLAARVLHAVARLGQGLLQLGTLLAQLFGHVFERYQSRARGVEFLLLLGAGGAQGIKLAAQRLLTRLHLLQAHGLGLAKGQPLAVPAAQLIDLRRQFAALGLQALHTLAGLLGGLLALVDFAGLRVHLEPELLEQLRPRDHAALLVSGARMTDPVTPAPGALRSDDRLLGRQLRGERERLGLAVHGLDQG
jgi:hypothetical protein